MELLSFDIALRLIIAVILGTIIGSERELIHKTAGMRTHALVALGTALFITISEVVIARTAGLIGASLNPVHIAAYVVSGIGFLGAGVIYKQEDHVSGVTSAAGLWACAGVGIACGYQLYGLAIFATILILGIFVFLWKVERLIRSLHKE
jgi:putative Mg2+ transporter-C (MgtC) family protein